MPNFSVPNQINPGDSLDANKAMANWNQVVTDLNGAKVDNTNIAANTLTAANMNTAFANGNVEPAFSGYKEILRRSAQLTALGTTTNILSPVGAVGAGAVSAGTVFYLDPADYTAGSRATKYRLRASWHQNATAPAVTINASLFPVTASAGGGAGTNILTLAALVAGSTVSFATPGASSQNQANSGDFAAPAAGYYCLACATSAGTMATNSTALLDVALQMRQV